MNITQRFEGDIVFGLVEIPTTPAQFREEGEISFYFEIDSRLRTPRKYEEGKLIVGGNLVAEFEYKNGSLSISSRYYEKIGKYASAIEGAVKELEYFFKISSY